MLISKTPTGANQVELFYLFKRYGSLPKPFLSPDDVAKYQAIASALNIVRSTTILPLRARTITIQEADGFPRPIELYAESASLLDRLAPTSVLIRGTIVDGKPKLALFEFDTNSDEIVIHFNAQLDVDPWLRRTVEDRLRQEQSGDQYAGMFDNWDLVAEPLVSEGIDSARSTISVSGNDLECTLVLKTDEPGLLALDQLTPH